MTCEVSGCTYQAIWTVGDDRRRKKVCRKCRDELVGFFGWFLLGSLDRSRL